MHAFTRHRLATAAFGALMAVLALTAGCGYKGDLYMPPPDNPDNELTVPPESRQTTPAGQPGT